MFGLKRLFLIIFTLIGIFGFLSFTVEAQSSDLHQARQDLVRAKVVEIVEQSQELIPGTTMIRVSQSLIVEIREGDRKGEEVVVNNDVVEMGVGDVFFLAIFESIDGSEYFVVTDPDRTWVLIFFTFLFVAAVLSFGFWKGIRALISLIVSFGVIIFFLIPALLQGAPPVPTTVFFASVILFFAMYITHGINRITHAAFLGTSVTIAAISLLAHLAVSWAKLSGFHSDEAVYLYLDTGGSLDMAGLLLGAIIIGVLGVLDDISITQAATVREMTSAAPHLSKLEIFRRTLSVGKEHVVSLVNTLALAYAGVALPLLLLFADPVQPWSIIVNMEIFAVEILRTLIGSIGLIMAVPVTTAFAVYLAVKPADGSEDDLELPHHHHHH